MDCVGAYEGASGMTCAAGALERIVMSLVPACLTGKDNAEYETIVAIISANPEKLIPEYIRDWYKLHKTGTEGEFPTGTTEAEKKADLKRYLLEKLPDQGELIDAKIAEIADNIGYEDDDFSYGGRRRKTRKSSRKSNMKRKTMRI